MPCTDSLPTYKDVVAYYLRDDVAAFMWRLCQSRLLRFFHHSPYDLRTERKTPPGLAIHGLASVDDLRERIQSATRDVPSYPYPFFPFWGMQPTTVEGAGGPVPGLWHGDGPRVGILSGRWRGAVGDRERF